MSQDSKADPTETYVLEETAITRLNSLEELAELALSQDEGRPGPADVDDDQSSENNLA